MDPGDALDFLQNKVLQPSAMTSGEWGDVPAELRARAFFSSQVESAQVLGNMQSKIEDFLEQNRNENGTLKTGSRADFVDQMQEWLAQNGISRSSGDVQDITSQGRLGLIFNTQVRQANDYGYWKQGMNGDVLEEFPAQRFIRVIAVKEPRLNHEEFQGKVFLKWSPVWLVINQDFGVPWGPWGWGCGHDVEDVDWQEAEELGLKVDMAEAGAWAKRWKFNTGLQASAQSLDPALVEKLKGVFGDRIGMEGDSIVWKGQ